MAKPARKKFQEALRALKQACKNDRLPFTLRIRAAELICAIYGVPLPESSVRIKRAVKEIVAEGQLEKQVRDQVKEQERTKDAVASARAFLQSLNNKEANEQSAAAN